MVAMRFRMATLAVTALAIAGARVDAAATIVTGVSAVSLGVGKAAVVGGVGVGGVGAVVKMQATNWWEDALGTVLVTAGIAVVVVDPPDATYYFGDFLLHYDPALFRLSDAGWLGDWGDTPSDLAPPVHPLGFPGGAEFVVHGSNPAMASTIVDDGTAGELRVSFDWGPAGLAIQGPGKFNFFAGMLEARETVRMRYLGTSATPIAGANLFATSGGLACSLPGEDEIRTCGDIETQYFLVERVPEPGIWATMIGGFAIAGMMVRRRKPVAGPVA